MKTQVILHRSAGISSLLILARRYSGSDGPEHYQDWAASKDCEKQSDPQATPQLASQVPRNDCQQSKEEDIAEGVAARCIGRERSIFYGRVLSYC